MNRWIAAFALSLLAGGAAAEELPAIARHKGVYDLSLISSSGPREIQSARGRIAFDFSRDACGYGVEFRQVLVLSTSETGDVTTDLRSTSFEGGDGKSFRFKSELRNGSGAPVVVDGVAAAAPGLAVRLTRPRRDAFALPAQTNFPTAHLRKVLAAAKAGETTLNLPVFDGSEDGRKVYDTFAVIGRPLDAGHPPEEAAKGAGIAGLTRWPVKVSYFTPGEGERLPVYSLAFELYENGVSGALRLDYGDFVLRGEMRQLDLRKASDGCRK